MLRTEDTRRPAAGPDGRGASRRARPDRGRRARRDLGQATIEYAGAIIIIAAILAAAVGTTAPIVAPRIVYGICMGYKAALNKLGVGSSAVCASAYSKNLPQCVTYRQDRTLGIDGTFMFIRADKDGNDQIYVTKDPVTGKEKAYVILGGNTDIGVGGGVGAGKISIDGKATIGGGTGTVYEFDSQKDAQDFLDSRRGNLGTQILGTLTGGVADGIYDSVKGLWGDDGPSPSGVTVNLSVQAEGNIGAEIPLKNKVIQGGLGVGAEGQEAGQFRYNKDGTSQLSVTWSGSISGDAGLQSKAGLPGLGKLGIGGGKTWSGSIGYRVNFDKNGNPTTFTVTTEHGSQDDFHGGSEASEVSANDGNLTVDTYTLDLTTPTGKKAFDDTFPSLAAGTLTSPVSAPLLLGTDNPLSKEIQNNAIQMEQTYDTEGAQGGGDAPSKKDEFGIHVGPFGIGATDETSRRKLTGARIKAPGGQWEDLAKCK